MFYVKNVPLWERVLRSAVGIIILLAAYFHFQGILQYALYATGITAGLTGFFGFCPMCYLYGRKL